MLNSVLDELKAKANERTRATYVRHGVPRDRVFGVSVADLKLIARPLKGQQSLAMELYATGNMEAMYLAGMVANGAAMSEVELQAWAEGAEGIAMIESYTVPWVAVENAAGRELALKWIASKHESLGAVGWATYSGLVTVTPDDSLDLAEIQGLLATVGKDMAGAKDRVRKTMNAFVIAVGLYVAPLSQKAKAVAVQLGTVSVNAGDTACKVPPALEYISKAEKAGKVGVKRKTIRC